LSFSSSAFSASGISQLSFAGRAGKVVTPRISHTTIPLEDGRVLIAGGMLRAPTFAILDTAEITACRASR